MLQYLLIIVALLFSFHSSLCAKEIHFVHIGLNDGLSQSTLYSIDQDQQGYIWIATQDGLNRYDGYEFTVFRNDPTKSNSLSSNLTRHVRVDQQQQIWVATSHGLSCYQPKYNRFENFYYQPKGGNVSINSFQFMPDSTMALATPDGLIFFDPKTKKFAQPEHEGLRELTRITSVLRVSNHLFVGAKTGLFKYDLINKTLENIHFFDAKEYRILDMVLEGHHKLWLATEGLGLFCYNLSTKEIRHFANDPKEVNSLSSDFVRTLAFDNQDRLWVGTFRGLNILDTSTGEFESYYSDPTQPGSLSQNSVRSLFLDNQGGMWLGTYFGGINYYHSLKNQFTHLQHEPYRNSLSNNIVTAIQQDDQGELWIGTNEGGLNSYNLRSQHFRHYNLPPFSHSDRINENVKAIYVDPVSRLVYIGSHAGGLTILNASTGSVRRFTYENSRIPDVNIYSIVAAGPDKLLLGTLNGLICFHKSDHSFHLIDQDIHGEPLQTKRIKTLFVDSKSRLWLGSSDGIEVVRLEEDRIEIGDVAPLFFNSSVNSIQELSDRTIAIATRTGLYLLQESLREVKHYTIKNGLPNDVVYGVVEDSYGRLWVSTNLGLSCLQRHDETFRNYSEVDGLQSNQFNTGAFCRASNGEIFFGGINGITSFRPELLIDNPYTPRVVFTNFQLYHKDVSPSDGSGVLTQTIGHTKELHLSPEQRSFSVEYTVPNYISGRHNTFKYRLEGYEVEWVHTQLRSISYSNLPPGSYKLQVVAANNDGKWNNQPTELAIFISPFWYQTWWGWLLILGGLIAMIIFLFRFFWYRKSIHSQIEHERVDLERIEEINRMKENFFISVSHELKMPLSMILAPLQELINRTPDRWSANQLAYINRNAQRLLYIVNQLVEHAKANTGQIELSVSQVNMHEMLMQTFQFYDKLAQKKLLEYNFFSDIQDKLIWADASYIDLILNSLLSHAFRFAEQGGSIVLKASTSNGNLILQVIDYGQRLSTKQIASDELNMNLIRKLSSLHHGSFETSLDEQTGQHTATVMIPYEESSYTEQERSCRVMEREFIAKEKLQKDTSFLEERQEEEFEADQPETTVRGRLLLVDPNAEITTYLKSMLSSSYQVFVAVSAEEALNLVKEQDIDVIISEYTLAPMDGLKLCKQIKQNIRTCHIPFLFLTANYELTEQMKGYAAGANDYMPKPFSVSLLSMKIRNLLITQHRAYDRYSKSMDIEPERLTTNPMDEELIRRAMEVVKRNLDNPEFTTDYFAREMNMSRSNLHLKLKAITGKSAIDFVHKIRFGEACALLQENRFTVAEVSTMVGFSTPSYFATSFKKHVGCLPTEYAKKTKV